MWVCGGRIWKCHLYPFSLETIILVISVPSRRSNQSILKKINPESSLEGLNLTLKLQHFGHLMSKQLTHWKNLWCWERSRAGGEEGVRGWDGWMESPVQQTWTWATSGRWWEAGRPRVLQSMGSWRVGHDWVTEQWATKHLHKWELVVGMICLVGECHFPRCAGISGSVGYIYCQVWVMQRHKRKTT